MHARCAIAALLLTLCGSSPLLLSAADNAQPASPPVQPALPVDQPPADQPPAPPAPLPGDGNGGSESTPPKIPSLEEIQGGKAGINNFIPTNFQFRVAVIGDISKDFLTDAGPQKQIKT